MVNIEGSDKPFDIGVAHKNAGGYHDRCEKGYNLPYI
jgi:hypothetical protein